jgi:UDP-4-amino-4,6-dideoxy-N-acetyl-beta-L-altrosamine transaminase
MTEAHTFLPYSRQWVEDEDIAAVASALRRDFLTTGPLVDAFETEFARATGARFAIACNSGTAALHLAAMALGLGPGQAAVVPTVTFLASANAVRMTGAEVIFADVDPFSGLMTPATFAEALDRASSQNVKAVVPVHLNGAVCAMAELAAIVRPRGIGVIEDACHSLGVPEIGSNAYSDVACFSTHPVKTIATGEGGVAVTMDGRLARKMTQSRNHGMTREKGDFLNGDLAFENGVQNAWYYEMHELGWNYRQPDILCALGLSQLQKLDRFWRRRTEIAALYDRLLAALAPIMRPVSRGRGAHGWHLYVLLVDFQHLGMTRTQLMDALRDKGIGTQVHYIPVHWQPYYRERYGHLSLPGAEAYYERCLSIPIFPKMSDDEVRYVAGTLANIVGTGG